MDGTLTDAGLVPCDTVDRCSVLDSSWARSHLRWLSQKDALGHDMFLIGPPSPLKRWLVYRWCEALGRAIEYVGLNPDTAESDLKSRRELRGDRVVWVDQAATRAALLGRVLLLEGIENAERNVLPALNNLLENREMPLDDGRFIVAAGRYDALPEPRDPRLLRCHPDFRVIVCGTPTPPFPGNPLDPPLRSRFQARVITELDTSTLIRTLGNADHRRKQMQPSILQLVAWHEALRELKERSAPGSYGVVTAAELLRVFPWLEPADVLHRVLPWCTTPGLLGAEAKAMLTELPPPNRSHPGTLQSAQPAALSIPSIQLRFTGRGGQHSTTVTVAGGTHRPMTPKPSQISSSQGEALTRMLQSMAMGRATCLLGPSGEGKTFVTNWMGRVLGHAQLQVMQMYEDMPARELLSRRSIDAREFLQVQSLLDSLSGLFPLKRTFSMLGGVTGTTVALRQLLMDREVTLPDGTKFLAHKTFNKLTNPSTNLLPIAAGFCVVALATTGTKEWITPEHLAMFHFVSIPVTSELAAAQVLRAAVPSCPTALRDALLLARKEFSRSCRDPGSALWTDNRAEQDEEEDRTQLLSLRMVLRAARRAAAVAQADNLMADVGNCLWHALMTDFMPRPERAAVRVVLTSVGLEPEPAGKRSERAAQIEIQEADWSSVEPVAVVGDIEYAVKQPGNVGLVPSTVFFDIPQHKLILRDMLRDMKAGENMLLIGNQGVGKNKITDRLLMLLQREREYIQLHRDTTVSSLLLAPSLRDGVVVYDDSPLVKAMQHGRVLIIDEFDKAPTEVVVILKGLLEDGEIELADGRHFSNASRSELGGHTIHPEFIVIALANRPGFPFLGNSFFAEMGDCFAVHTILNPDQQSEIALLSAYAPNMPASLLTVLTSVFCELREQVDKGKLSYPYSTRELVNIVQHMQRFPKDPIAEVLMSMLGFDSFDVQLQQTLFSIFERHGILIGTDHIDRAMQASVLAVPAPLCEPEQISSLVCEGIAVSEIIQAECSTCKHHTCGVAGCMQWRGMNTQDMLEAADACSTEANGATGAEWQSLKVHSCRTSRFSEEELWWRFGFVTQDNTLVKGTDPQTASWMGKMVAMQAAQGCVCILSSQMVLHVGDVERKIYREISLAVGATLSDRAFYATGQPLLSLPAHQCLMCYDYNNQALLYIWPRDGTVKVIELLAPKGADSSVVSCAGVLPASTVAVYFTQGGEIILAASCIDASREISVLRAAITIPTSIGNVVDVQLIGSHVLLVQMDDGKLMRLTISQLPEPGSSIPITAQLQRASAAPTLEETELRVLSCNHVQTENVQHQLWCAKSTFAAFSFTSNQVESTPVMGYRRGCLVAETLKQAGTADRGDPDLTKQTQGSIMHNATSSVVNTLSCGNQLDSSFGIVLLEVIQVQQSTIRQIVLCQTPGLGSGSANETGQSTGGDLAGRALQVTTGQTKPRKRALGMPACVAACEMEDGRLALLFADAHVRVLELRPELLAIQETLFQGLVGANVSEQINPRREEELFEEEDDDDDDDYYEEDDEEEQDSNDDDDKEQKKGRGRGKGKGSSRKGRGRRRRGERGGKGERGRRVGQRVDEVLRKARKLAQQAVNTERSGLQLEQMDDSEYEELKSTVDNEIGQLRTVLQAVEAKEKERTWLHGKTVGELDVGEKNVYKRRGLKNEARLFQRLPKRLSFVVDVSGSMAHFNSDLRLDRLCGAVVMLMEALHGLEHKYSYEVVGHSGETAWLPFVTFDHPPRDRAERLSVIHQMVDHSSRCKSGDNTLAAGAKAIRDIVRQDADDYFVFLISDANLEGYGISADALTVAMTSNPDVHSHVVFISEPDVAEEMQQRMPYGRAHCVLDNEELPLLLKDLFTRALLSPASKL